MRIGGCERRGGLSGDIYEEPVDFLSGIFEKKN